MSAVPLLPETAPFNADQRAWINGYLAGLFSFAGGTATAPQATCAPGEPLLILYGSQTGTAEALAQKIAKAAAAKNFAARAVCMADHATIDLKKESRALVVTSTYGDGDPPDNAAAFWDFLKSDTAPRLEHVEFSILALGDTNYEKFCEFGKKCDARFEELGAKRVHARADCDADYDATAKAWIDAVLGALSVSSVNGESKMVNETPLDAPNDASTIHNSPVTIHDRKNPFPAKLVTNRKLTADNSCKETRHFEISLEGSGLEYEVGDALGVCATNCPALVDEILAALGCDGEEAVPVSGSELPLRKTLLQHFEITKIPANFLAAVAERSGDAGLKAMLDPVMKDDLKKFLWGREIIDLLLAHPSVKFGAVEFVGFLKKMPPRLYSISSSPKTHPGQVHLTIAQVRYESHGRGRKGVASTFLADRASEAVPVFVQTSHGFRIPKNNDAAMIMVGPGTGIAPFRAFLEERRAIGAKGRNWLFFGEQRESTDFFYREEFGQMLSEGTLTKLTTAFSRDQAEKIYVQTRMIEHAAELWAWLRDGAHFYVCGDASRMAKDVDAALHTICETAGGLGKEAASEFVAKMKSEKRYQRDVY